MGKINDGGPAFPFVEQNADGSPYWQSPGMTLRDWFAGQALTLYTADGEWDPADHAEKVARLAYVLADAMLAAREGR